MTALALGTVQFGLQYGVANKTGQVSPTEAEAILSRAARSGIDTLDTAIAYGDSERRLGEIGVGQWRVVTKLPPLPPTIPNAQTWVEGSIRDSLERLRVARLAGLLLHRSLDLLGPQGDALYRAMLAAREQGKVEKIGVSIYDPEELVRLKSRFSFDLVQAPFNVIDRRLESSGWLDRLHDAGVEIHIRSIFLQGLLLMQPQSRPMRFMSWQNLWQDWQRWLERTNLTPLQACLGFALSQRKISRVVVGVDRDLQLKDILDSVSVVDVQPPESLINSDPQLINPLSWITS